MDSPPTTVRDTTLLLDIDVYQPAWPVDFVSHRFRFPHRQASGVNNMHELWHPVPGQNATDYGTRNMQVIRDPVRPPPASEPQRDNPMLGLS